MLGGGPAAKHWCRQRGMPHYKLWHQTSISTGYGVRGWEASLADSPAPSTQESPGLLSATVPTSGSVTEQRVAWCPSHSRPCVRAPVEPSSATLLAWEQGTRGPRPSCTSSDLGCLRGSDKGGRRRGRVLALEDGSVTAATSADSWDLAGRQQHKS